MARHHRYLPVRFTQWIAIPALGAFTVAVSRASSGFTFAGTSWDGTTALLAAGLAALSVGLVHRGNRPANRVGPLLTLAGAAWFLGEWDGPGVGSSFVFSVGLVTSATDAALVAHLVLAYPTGRLGSWPDRLVVAAGYAVTVVLGGVVPAMLFDPRAQGCTGCADNLWLVAGRPALLARLERLDVHAGLGWAVVVILAVCWRMVSASTARRRVIGWVSLAGLAYLGAVATAYVNGLDRGQLGTTELDRRLWLTESAAMVALAAAVGWGLLRSRRSRRSLARLVVDLDTAASPGGLRDALAARLGDPELLLAYRVGADRWADALALPVAMTSVGGRETTAIGLAGSDAVLVHRVGLLDSPDLVRELRTAMHLGLESERLQAVALTQLADLQASRSRLIEAGDQERRRLERDLHDGAQQHLVGVLLALRLLRSRMGGSAEALSAAEVELRGAIDELRDLARGLYPVVLRDEGLAAALHALAEIHHLRVVAVPADRLPVALETTAYLVAARAVAGGPVSVTVTRSRDQVVVDVTVRGDVDDLGDLGDRVSALGGRLSRSRLAEGECELHVVLPLPPGAGTEVSPSR